MQAATFSTQDTPIDPHAYPLYSDDWKFRIIEMAVQRDPHVGRVPLHTLRARYYQIFTRVTPQGTIVPAF